MGEKDWWERWGGLERMEEEIGIRGGRWGVEKAELGSSSI